MTIIEQRAMQSICNMNTTFRDINSTLNSIYESLRGINGYLGVISDCMKNNELKGLELDRKRKEMKEVGAKLKETIENCTK